MSRWHTASCVKPNVQAADLDTPHCISCGSRCRWRELIPPPDSSSPNLNIPEDKPIGQLDLHWPPLVSFQKPQREASDPTTPQFAQDEIAEENVDGQVARLQLPPVPSISSRESNTVCETIESPIYGDMLAPDEIRLACLFAAENDEFPIHVSLEVYRDVNCPEYETASYTWGGEDGDYSLSMPIFVGPFWDVLFQTKNAWELLRFARPWRGARMLWVDALCINQGNIQEREEQVAKMGHIYERCLRVIVYLGPDLVPLLPRGKFSTRHRLSELRDGSVSPRFPPGHQVQATPVTFANILQRKYFERVWVIQELLLSPGAVIRIGDVDFWTDSTPWPDAQKAGVIDFHWSSTPAPWFQYIGKKSFPVQNSFEVLQLTSSSQASDPRDRIFGLLSLMDLDDPGWQPDYSLSPQQVYIGLFAHFVVNLGIFDFLQFATGLMKRPSLPSWMPDWSIGISQCKLEEGGLWAFSRYPRSHGNSEVTKAIRQIYDLEVSTVERIEYIHNAVIQQHRDRYIAVSTETGALSMDLIHFCTIPGPPKCMKPLPSGALFQVGGGFDALYLASKHPLDAVVKPGCDHIYILTTKKETWLYLILRETPGDDAFRFVACVSYLFVDPNFRQLQHINYWITLLKRVFDNCCDLSQGHLGFPFCGVEHSWDLLIRLQRLQKNQTSSLQNFKFVYLSCVNSEFQPTFESDYLKLSLPATRSWTYLPNDVNDFQSRWSWLGWRKMFAPWQYTDTYHGGWIHIEHFRHNQLPCMTSLRVELDTLRMCCKEWLEIIAAVQRVFNVDNHGLEAMLRHGCKEKQVSVMLPPPALKTVLMKKIKLDIYADRVLII